MLRFLAPLFGVCFISFGVLGFLPDFVEQGRLFDIFRTNFEHNVLLIITGILAILCGLTSSFASKMFFTIGGVVYLLLALFGYLQGNEMLLEMFAVNTPANILHGALGIIFLTLGLAKE